jgi:mannose-6-phosphate isomerase-like protein (cupin superfamily)
MAGGSAQRLRDEGLDPGAWSNGPGDRYAAHEHGYDKVIVVERGSIRFGLPATAETIDLEAGDRLELPAGTSHDAIVGGLGVTCLEAHLPSGTLERPHRRGAGEW